MMTELTFWVNYSFKAKNGHIFFVQKRVQCNELIRYHKHRCVGSNVGY